MKLEELVEVMIGSQKVVLSYSKGSELIQERMYVTMINFRPDLLKMKVDVVRVSSLDSLMHILLSN